MVKNFQKTHPGPICAAISAQLSPVYPAPWWQKTTGSCCCCSLLLLALFGGAGETAVSPAAFAFALAFAEEAAAKALLPLALLL